MFTAIKYIIYEKKKKNLFALTVNREIKITGKIVDLNLMVSGCQEMLV